MKQKITEKNNTKRHPVIHWISLELKITILTDWLTDWLYSHNQTLHINSDIENYNVQDRKE